VAGRRLLVLGPGHLAVAPVPVAQRVHAGGVDLHVLGQSQVAFAQQKAVAVEQEGQALGIFRRPQHWHE